MLAVAPLKPRIVIVITGALRILLVEFLQLFAIVHRLTALFAECIVGADENREHVITLPKCEIRTAPEHDTGTVICKLADHR